MPKRILIADDNAGFRQVIKDRLFKAFKIGHYEASNGREALELAAKSKPDLVILDVSMPEMDGIAAARYLKASMPEIPVVLFTMYDLDDNAAKLGVDAVVSKSSFGKLINTVSALCASQPEVRHESYIAFHDLDVRLGSVAEIFAKRKMSVYKPGRNGGSRSKTRNIR